MPLFGNTLKSRVCALVILQYKRYKLTEFVPYNKKNSINKVGAAVGAECIVTLGCKTLGLVLSATGSAHPTRGSCLKIESCMAM